MDEVYKSIPPLLSTEFQQSFRLICSSFRVLDTYTYSTRPEESLLIFSIVLVCLRPKVIDLDVEEAKSEKRVKARTGF